VRVCTLAGETRQERYHGGAERKAQTMSNLPMLGERLSKGTGTRRRVGEQGEVRQAKTRCGDEGKARGGKTDHLWTVARERGKACQELKKNNSKRPPIDTKAVLLAEENLRRQVFRRPDNVLPSTNGLGRHLVGDRGKGRGWSEKEEGRGEASEGRRDRERGGSEGGRSKEREERREGA
jgi:hypothetical protein